MALVTLMSDFGTEDHYVAAVKAALLQANPSINIIDISHQIQPADIGHAGYVLKSVYRDFPPNTVHLCSIDNTSKIPSALIALKLDEQYFVGYNSGLFSLISENKPLAIIELNKLNNTSSTFIAKDILAPVAAALASGKDIHEMGSKLPELYSLFPRQLKVTKREIAGNVIRIDHYGNLITNISKSAFETIMKIIGSKPYEVCYGKQKTRKIHSNFHEVESGDCFILFNSNDLLQIGINKGNAAELLGLKHDYPVIINFES